MKVEEIQRVRDNARRTLLSARNSAGVWEGELSSSALSTATAVVALSQCGASENAALIRDGVNWLVANQNADGGWGDTVLSYSNISTTLLCYSALTLNSSEQDSSAHAREWIERTVGSLNPADLVRAVTARYGKDRTFAVPILMMCAISGVLGNEEQAWQRVPPLPFELAVFPRRLFGALKLPVVSYALPALIAIGYARHFHAPSFFLVSTIRSWAWPRVSSLLEKIQPESGGFLEATPLTSFVVMALASSGEASHQVAREGVGFIRNSVRSDGSWPIDTNLTTWCTTLATKALAVAETKIDSASADFTLDHESRIRDWLLKQQYRSVHPYTNAAPGGWAWTDLSGGVPDADDTAGALLALDALGCEDLEAIEAALTWLMDLQNGDGGTPTFCKGWGAFPFDRSSQDITAHALRAFLAWKGRMPTRIQKRIDYSISRGLVYLERTQGPDGSWSPLWFGNQDSADENNRVYGTAMTLLALEKMGDRSEAKRMYEKGFDWLRFQQNEDGGWGGEKGCLSSLEETGLALDALAPNSDATTLERGVAFIEKASDGGTCFPAAPIGFYFAKLWYFETLYPNIWALSGLERTLDRLS